MTIEYRNLTIQKLEERAKSIELKVKHNVECGKWDTVEDADIIASALKLVKNIYSHATWLRLYNPASNLNP